MSNIGRILPEAAARLMTADEVARMLKVPVSWVYKYARGGLPNRIPGFRLGKYWRFREAEILAWLEQQKAGR